MKIKPTPETIWKRPAYLPYVHPPLTDSVIHKAEQALGCKLPESFLDILRVQNGGPIRFSIPDSVGDCIAGIGESYPSITKNDLSDYRDYVDFQLDGLVPFDGDGHWYYCLDYRSGSKEPGVTYIDTECNSDLEEAKSFGEFLQLMELNLEGELVLGNVEGFEHAQTKLESIFGVQCEQKMSNICVPYFSYKTGKKWNHSCWITPNKVAAGYSGDNSQSIKFEGEALLFPELPSDTVIFEASEEYFDSYKRRLEDAGLLLVDINEAASADSI